MKKNPIKRLFVVSVLGLAGVSCQSVELPKIGTQLAGPVGLAVGCPGDPSAGCTGGSVLYVTNANNNLVYDSGSLLAIDLSKVDVTNRVNLAKDVVATTSSGAPAVRELLNFSGKIALTQVAVNGGAPQSVALVSNRYSEERGQSSDDRIYFISPDPDAGMPLIDIDPDTPDVQPALTVGEDPFGIEVDAAGGIAYVANSTSGTVTAISLIDDCERVGEEVDPEPAPCILDSISEPSSTVAELTPADDMLVPDVALTNIGVSSDFTPTDTWTVTFVEDASGFACPGKNGFWRVTADVSGPQTLTACTDVPYTSDGAQVLFFIETDPDATDPELPHTGDTFTFETTAGDFVDFSPIKLAVDGTGISGRGVSEIALDPARGWLYATSRISSFFHVVDLATGLPEAIVPVATEAGGTDSRGIVLSPAGDEVFVANRSPSSLLVLSTSQIPDEPGTTISNDAVVDAIALGGGPAGTLLTADGSQVLVSCVSAKAVYSVDVQTHTVTGLAPVGTGAFSLALDPTGTLLFVANYSDDTISVLDADPASPDYLRVLTTIQNSSK